MDDPNSPLQSHCDGHCRFRDGVHRAGCNWSLQRNGSREAGQQLDIVDSKIDVARHANQVIKGISNLKFGAFQQISRRMSTSHLMGKRYTVELLARLSIECLDMSLQTFNIVELSLQISMCLIMAPFQRRPASALLRMAIHVANPAEQRELNQQLRMPTRARTSGVFVPAFPPDVCIRLSVSWANLNSDSQASISRRHLGRPSRKHALIKILIVAALP